MSTTKGHHPTDDEYKKYSLEEFIEVAKKELDDYRSQFEGGNAHTDAHTWDEWMGSFKRYMSW